MAKIKYSFAAVKDLEGIGDYISKTLKSPMAALNITGKIQDAIDKLSDFPFIGSPLSSVVEADKDYRFLICGNYLVFYRAKEDSVYIDRVIYGRRDYIQILFGETPSDGK